eukprot:GHVH01011851.1.p1 GENE.GHVH01011851.1~~GHVH01011851.1.p1  ORF type:complete len:152 (+),score=10.31 GHVH01011851.1:24-458(+)
MSYPTGSPHSFIANGDSTIHYLSGGPGLPIRRDSRPTYTSCGQSPTGQVYSPMVNNSIIDSSLLFNASTTAPPKQIPVETHVGPYRKTLTQASGVPLETYSKIREGVLDDDIFFTDDDHPVVYSSARVVNNFKTKKNPLCMCIR